MSERAAGRTPVMGTDETLVKAPGKAKLVGFAADAESGEPLGIDMPLSAIARGSRTGSKDMWNDWE